MSAMELDPVFSRALRLLHSRARDSADQLRALLDEVRLRAGRAPTTATNANASPRSAPALKRPGEKLKEDGGEVVGKRPRVDSPPVPFKSHTPSPTLSRDSDASKKSDDSDPNDTAGLEMDFMNQLACVVCRNMSVGSGNQLIECQDCGNLYHQECHRPPITDSQRADTRSVWRCRHCRDPPPTVPSAAAAATAAPGRSLLKPTVVSGVKFDRTKSDGSLPERDSKATVRLETGSSSVSAVSAPLVAGAGRPAGTSLLKSKATKSLSVLGAPAKPTASTSSAKPALPPKTASSRPVPGSPSAGKSAPASSAGLPPPNSMVSAERRMQLMKKKAAAKLNEKRKN